MRPVAAGGAFRVVARDLRLSNGLVLPRGVTITGSNLSLLNSPLVWDRPERFMPVRRTGDAIFILLCRVGFAGWCLRASCLVSELHACTPFVLVVVCFAGFGELVTPSSDLFMFSSPLVWDMPKQKLARYANVLVPVRVSCHWENNIFRATL